MSNLDEERARLVSAIDVIIDDRHVTINELIRNIPADVWNSDLFDEAVMRHEIHFDGTVVFYTAPVETSTVDRLLNSLGNNGDYYKLAGMAAFFRTPVVRASTVGVKFEALCRLLGYSEHEAVEEICEYATSRKDTEVHQTPGYFIAELFGVNVFPGYLQDLINDQLRNPTHRLKLRELEHNVSAAEVRLNAAKDTLAAFKLTHTFAE